MNSINSNNTQIQQHQVAENKTEKSEKVVSDKNALDKIKDYFEPRIDTAKGIDTSGDMPYSSRTSAAMGGAIKGLFSLGVAGAVTGVASGVAGVAVGEETGSSAKAYLAGATVGAGSYLASTTALAAISGTILPGATGIGLASASGAVGGALGTLIEKSLNDKEAKTAELNQAQGITETPSKGKKMLKKLAPIAAGTAAGAAIGIVGGPSLAIASAISGGIGGAIGAGLADKLPENADKKETAKMALLSAGVGAGVGALAGAGTETAMSANPEFVGTFLGVNAMMGALTGTSATISASRLSETRDSSTSGYAAAMLTNAVTGLGGPAMNMASSIGAAIGSKAGSKLDADATLKQKCVSTAKKIGLSAGAGAAIGAATGAFAGPVGMAVGAGIGAVTSTTGALVGPKVNQAIRNATADFQKLLAPAADKVSKFALDKLGTDKGLTAVGSLVGVIGGIPLIIAAGALAGPIGAAVALVGSAVMSGVKFAGIAKDIGNTKQIEALMPKLEEINDVMCQIAYHSIAPQLEGMTDEQKQAFYNDLQSQSFEELKGKEKEINAYRKNLSNAVYAQFKEPLKDVKGKEAKKEFLESQVELLKPEILQILVQGAIQLGQEQEQAEQGQEQTEQAN